MLSLKIISLEKNNIRNTKYFEMLQKEEKKDLLQGTQCEAE